MKIHQARLILGAAAGLTACGGGDASDPAPVSAASEVPASATVSAKAYQQFAASLSNSETATPLNVNTVSQAPTSETEAPATL